jgi:hypothetical protein
VVKAQLEAMKSQYQAHKRANSNVFGNKGWHKPGLDAKAPTPQQKSKNELHALMEKEVDCRVANRLSDNTMKISLPLNNCPSVMMKISIAITRRWIRMKNIMLD